MTHSTNPFGQVPVALVCTLQQGAPRYIETAGLISIEGELLPHVVLEPFAPLQAICVELALRTYGLP